MLGMRSVTPCTASLGICMFKSTRVKTSATGSSATVPRGDVSTRTRQSNRAVPSPVGRRRSA